MLAAAIGGGGGGGGGGGIGAEGVCGGGTEEDVADWSPAKKISLTVTPAGRPTRDTDSQGSPGCTGLAGLGGGAT